MKRSFLLILMSFGFTVSAFATDEVVTTELLTQKIQASGETSVVGTLAPYILGGLVLVIGLLIGIAKSKRGID